MLNNFVRLRIFFSLAICFKIFLYLKFSEEEKRHETLRKDNLELNFQLTAKLSEISNLSDANERQINELNRVTDENNRLNDCLNQTETSLRDIQLKLQDKTDEVN